MAGVILMYHNIAENERAIDFPEWAPIYDVQYSDFLLHLQVIRESKYKISLTFDDGYSSIYEHVLPLLDHYSGLSCTCFVTTGVIRQAGMLTKSQIRKLAENKITIGTHSHSHVFLEGLDENDLEQEIRQPKNILEDLTGCEITNISLPGGRYDSRTLNFAAKCGYHKVFTSRPGTKEMAIAKTPGLELVPRWAITAKTSLATLENIVNCKRWYITSRKTKFMAGKLAKRVLGNSGYHYLWHKKNN